MDTFKDYKAEDASASGGPPPSSGNSAPPPPPKEEEAAAPQPEAPSKPQPSQPSGAVEPPVFSGVHCASAVMIACAAWWSGLRRCECNSGRVHEGGRVVASPYARKLAREAGVDVSDASGSGPGGRIVAADVQQLISSGTFAPLAACWSAYVILLRDCLPRKQTCILVAAEGIAVQPARCRLPVPSKRGYAPEQLKKIRDSRQAFGNYAADLACLLISALGALLHDPMKRNVFIGLHSCAVASSVRSLATLQICIPHESTLSDVLASSTSGGAPKKKAEAPKAATKGAPEAPAAAPATSRTPGGYHDVPNSNIRKITAQRLLESKQKVLLHSTAACSCLYLSQPEL